MSNARLKSLDYDPKTGIKDKKKEELTAEEIEAQRVAEEERNKNDNTEGGDDVPPEKNKEVHLNKDKSKDGDEPDGDDLIDFWGKASEILGRDVSKKEDFIVEKEVKVEVEKIVDKDYATEFSKKYDEYWKKYGGTPSNFIEASEDIKGMTPEDVVKKALKNNNPNFNQSDIDFDFKDAYGIDEDSMEEDEIRRRKIAFKKAVNASTKELESFQKDFFVPNENSQSSIEEKNKVAIAEQEKNRGLWRDAVGNANSEMKGFDIKIADDFSFTQKYSHEDLSSMKKVVSDDSFQEWMKKYADDKGTLDTKSIQRDEYIRNNFSKIIKSVAEQARAYERGEIKKQDKHIDFKSDKKKPSISTLPKHMQEKVDLLKHKYARR